nr:hypothetical protein [Tanacetum cinerariifolium]
DKEAHELSQEELQQMMIIVPMQGMNIEALQTKYPIITGRFIPKALESIGRSSEWEIILRHLHAGREGVSIIKRNSYNDVGCKSLGGSR